MVVVAMERVAVVVALVVAAGNRALPADFGFFFGYEFGQRFVV